MVAITVNGQPRTVEVDPATPLLGVLRDTLGLTGTKYGCGMALCGSCTVLLEDEPIRSCVTPVAAVSGRKLTTNVLLKDCPLTVATRCSALGWRKRYRSAVSASPVRS